MMSVLCRSLTVSLLVVISGFAARQATAQDLDIYSEALGSGWQDWSWDSTRNFANASPVHAGTKSISVTPTAPWGALFLYHSAVSTGLYTSLSFYINGGATGTQAFTVRAQRNGVLQPQSVSVGPLAGGSVWQQVTIPLSSLGIANVNDFDRFWLQDSTGITKPTYYVDDMKLVATPAPSTVNINVNATQVLQTVDKRVFGVNTAIWDGSFSQSSTTILLQSADIKIMRFPGGSSSDSYHWATNRSDGNNFDWATGFSSFATVATAIGSDAFITVNYGSGTPAEAASWVQNSNVTHSYNFKYWEIGNENYGNWENDTNTRPNDPQTYATRVQSYWNQMKAVDPTIKIGVVAVTGEDSYANYGDLSAVNPRTSVSHSGWTPVMLAKLKQLGITPNFVIYHRYDQAPFAEDDATLLQSSSTWGADAADLRQQLNDYLGTTTASAVELICTENNSVYTQPGKQTTSLVNALFYADSLCQLLKTEFRSMVWWDLRNAQESGNNNSGSLYGWRGYGDYGIMSASSQPYPTYYAMKLMKYFARGGDQFVGATSDYQLLSAYAARRANGSLCVLVINKSQTNTLNAQFTISNYNAPGSATTYSYGIPQDTAAQTGSGNQDITTGSSSVGQSFSMSFAPYSLTVLSMAGTPVPVTVSGLELQ